MLTSFFVLCDYSEKAAPELMSRPLLGGFLKGGVCATLAWAVAWPLEAVWKSKFYGAFVLNHRVVLHAIDATPARWRDDAGSLPLDGASTAASSPRNDLVRIFGAPDALVDFYTVFHRQVLIFQHRLAVK